MFLWHIDGNHKLIRWVFVIHCEIDGHSRRINYLYCSLNAAKVLALHVEAVQDYGLPSKVREDHGTKNSFVATFMQSCNRGSYIMKKNCCNQRIEQLHRDLFVGCTSVFYCVLMYLEENVHLEISNDIHIIVLYYAFEPIINRHL